MVWLTQSYRRNRTTRALKFIANDRARSAAIERLEERRLFSGYTIGGAVYNDANHNGQLDSGETALQGRTVYIDANNNGKLDAGERQTTTDSLGIYDFGGLAPGPYVIREITPAGWLQTAPASGYSISLTTQSYYNEDFGQFKLAGISGAVFNDVNDNGVYNGGEPGLSGRTVYIDSNDNGKLDAGEPTAVTSSTGAYSFIGLSANTYDVREITPSGWKQTLPASFYSIALSGGQQVSGKNFGQFKPTTGTLTGAVYSDANNDGVLNGGDTDLANWGVYLDANNNGVYNTGEKRVLTNAQGVYTFGNLAPGPYHVRVQLASGYALTAPAAGVFNVTLAAGQTITENFGASNRAIITGTVFFDGNQNGTFDSGEIGLANWVVYADLNNNGAMNSGEPNTKTDAHGIYSLVLAPGTYHLREVIQSGFSATKPTGGEITITLKAGEVLKNLNFGDY